METQIAIGMKIVLQGDFFDCQMRGDRFFVWDMWGHLLVVDLRDDIVERLVKGGFRQEIDYRQDVVKRHIQAGTRIRGGMFPHDSSFVGSYLYTATEGGLYKRYIETGERRVAIDTGKATKVFDVQLFELANGQHQLMAMAGGREGVFEMYNPAMTRIVKNGKLENDLTTRIYSVNKNYAMSVWYEDQNIVSSDHEGHSRISIFEKGERQGQREPVQRIYLKTEKLERYERAYLAGHIQHERHRTLPYTEGKEHLPINSRPMLPEVIFGRDDISPDYRRGEGCWINFQGVPKEFGLKGNLRRTMRGSFGYVAETKNEVLVVLKNGREIRIPGPITKSRVVSGLRGRRNLLVVVLNDHIEITDFYKEIYSESNKSCITRHLR